MESFKISGKKGYIKIKFIEVYGFPNRTSFAGGYDVKGIVEIKSGNYNVYAELWFSTGEIYNFYSSFKECYKMLDGEAKLLTTEGNLSMSINFNKVGHVNIHGEYKERYDEGNMLIFEIISDQSYFQETINDLNAIVRKYGGLEGV